MSPTEPEEVNCAHTALQLTACQTPHPVLMPGSTRYLPRMGTSALKWNNRPCIKLFFLRYRSVAFVVFMSDQLFGGQWWTYQQQRVWSRTSPMSVQSAKDCFGEVNADPPCQENKPRNVFVFSEACTPSDWSKCCYFCFRVFLQWSTYSAEVHKFTSPTGAFLPLEDSILPRFQVLYFGL